MEIYRTMSYRSDNVIKFKGKITEFEFQIVMKGLADYIELQGARKTGGVIIAVHVLYLETNVSDMEILVPVSKPIPSSGAFTYVPSFCLDDCIMAEFKGSPHLIPQTYTDIYRKAKSAGLEIKQPFYNVFAKEPQSFWHGKRAEMKIYASVN